MIKDTELIDMKEKGKTNTMKRVESVFSSQWLLIKYNYIFF